MAHALEILFSFVILAISTIAVLGNLNVFEVIGSGPSALLHFSRPQEVTIKDWKVGVVNWVITTIVVGLYVASETAAGRLQMSAFEDKIDTSGILISAWVDNSAFVKRAQEDLRTAPYCTTPYNFTYNYCNHSSADDVYNEFWCEDDIECSMVDSGEAAYRHTPNTLWALTYFKDRTLRRVPCDQPEACNATLREMHRTIEMSPGVCSCVRTYNKFVPGAEDVTFGFRARPLIRKKTLMERLESQKQEYPEEYLATSLFIHPVDPVTGQLTGERRRLSGADFPGLDWASDAHTVKAEEKTSWQTTKFLGFSVSELLQAAGFTDGLDTTDGDLILGPGRSGNPSLRITGVAFSVIITFVGSLTDEDRPVKVEVDILPQTGWHSVAPGGRLMDVTDQATGESMMVDRYARGVRVSFTFESDVGMFSWRHVVAQAAELLVFLVAGRAVVDLFAVHFLGAASKVYAATSSDSVDVKSVYKRSALQAVVAAASFAAIKRQWERDDAEAKDGGSATSVPNDAPQAEGGSFTEKERRERGVVSEQDVLRLLREVGMPSEDRLALLHCISEEKPDAIGEGVVSYKEVLKANSTAPGLKYKAISETVVKQKSFRKSLREASANSLGASDGWAASMKSVLGALSPRGGKESRKETRPAATRVV